MHTHYARELARAHTHTHTHTHTTDVAKLGWQDVRRQAPRGEFTVVVLLFFLYKHI